MDSEGDDGDDCAGVDITFLVVPLLAFSLRLISRWKVPRVLMLEVESIVRKESGRIRGYAIHRRG